ncbi:unnamed protein product [Polarella glacialis]|uniref:U-box domain-containing protein n=1 Tax=Polarella glacialis TaxID=89957 RepID=A0A813I0Y4_POLGL|nr:unnamed protein product [Polarella glacialis]
MPKRRSEVEEESDVPVGSRMRSRCFQSEPPAHLICPITLEVMADPVMAANNRTYERSAIKRWLQDSVTSTSPVTGAQLKNNIFRRRFYAVCQSIRESLGMPLPRS